MNQQYSAVPSNPRLPKLEGLKLSQSPEANPIHFAVEEETVKLNRIQKWLAILQFKKNLRIMKPEEEARCERLSQALANVREHAARLCVLALAQAAAASSMELTQLLAGSREGLLIVRVSCLERLSGEIIRSWKALSSGHSRALAILGDPSGHAMAHAYLVDSSYQRAWKSWRSMVLSGIGRICELVRELGSQTESQLRLCCQAFALQSSMVDFLLKRMNLGVFCHKISTWFVPVTVGELCVIMGKIVCLDGCPSILSTSRTQQAMDSARTPRNAAVFHSRNYHFNDSAKTSARKKMMGRPGSDCSSAGSRRSTPKNVTARKQIVVHLCNEAADALQEALGDIASNKYTRNLSLNSPLRKTASLENLAKLDIPKPAPSHLHTSAILLPMGTVLGLKPTSFKDEMALSHSDRATECATYTLSHTLPSASTILKRLPSQISAQISISSRETNLITPRRLVRAAWSGMASTRNSTVGRVAVMGFSCAQRCHFWKTHLHSKDKGSIVLLDDLDISAKSPILQSSPARPGTFFKLFSKPRLIFPIQSPESHIDSPMDDDFSMSEAYQSVNGMTEEECTLTKGGSTVNYMLSAIELGLRVHENPKLSLGNPEDEELITAICMKLALAESLGLQCLRWQQECVSYVTNKLQSLTDVGSSLEFMEKLIAVIADIDIFSANLERILSSFQSHIWAQHCINGIKSTLFQLQSANATMLELVEEIVSQVANTICQNHMKSDMFSQSKLSNNSPSMTTPVKQPNSKRLERIQTCDNDHSPKFHPAEHTSNYMKVLINKVLEPQSFLLLKVSQRCPNMDFILAKLVNCTCDAIGKYLLNRSNNVRISFEGTRVLHGDILCLSNWFKHSSSNPSAFAFCTGIGRFNHIIRILIAPMPMDSWNELSLKSFRALPDGKRWLGLRADRCQRSRSTQSRKEIFLSELWTT